MTAPLTAAAVAFVNAVGALLIAFNIVLTQTQLGAVVGVVNTGIAFLAIVVPLWRSRKQTVAVPAVKQ